MRPGISSPISSPLTTAVLAGGFALERLPRGDGADAIKSALRTQAHGGCGWLGGKGQTSQGLRLFAPSLSLPPETMADIALGHLQVEAMRFKPAGTLRKDKRRAWRGNWGGDAVLPQELALSLAVPICRPNGRIGKTLDSRCV